MTESGTSTWDELVELLGEAVALRLCHELGGREVWLPMTPLPRNRIVGIVGAAGHAALYQRYGKGLLAIPLGPTADDQRKRRKIRELIAQGLDNPQIAARTHCHIRTVRRLRNAEPSRQVDLFDSGRD